MIRRASQKYNRSGTINCKAAISNPLRINKQQIKRLSSHLFSRLPLQRRNQSRRRIDRIGRPAHQIKHQFKLFSKLATASHDQGPALGHGSHRHHRRLWPHCRNSGSSRHNRHHHRHHQGHHHCPLVLDAEPAQHAISSLNAVLKASSAAASLSIARKTLIKPRPPLPKCLSPNTVSEQSLPHGRAFAVISDQPLKQNWLKVLHCPADSKSRRPWPPSAPHSGGCPPPSAPVPVRRRPAPAAWASAALPPAQHRPRCRSRQTG